MFALWVGRFIVHQNAAVHILMTQWSEIKGARQGASFVAMRIPCKNLPAYYIRTEPSVAETSLAAQHKYAAALTSATAGERVGRP